MDTTPLLSVCIPAYNCERFIRDTVVSVTSQTYRNWELVIVEDCSSDRTLSVLDDLVCSLNDVRIRLYKNAVRLGMVGNWNTAVSHARGELIKLLCSDDTMAPTCLATQVRAIMQHPSVAIVASTRNIISARGVKLMVQRGFRREGIYNGRNVIRRTIWAARNIVGDPVAVLLRRADLAVHGLFDPAIRYYADLDLWLRLLRAGDLYYMTAAQCNYRLHPDATGNALRQVMFDDFFRVVDKSVAAGCVQLSRWQRLVLARKLRVVNLARQLVYATLANR